MPYVALGLLVLGLALLLAPPASQKIQDRAVEPPTMWAGQAVWVFEHYRRVSK